MIRFRAVCALLVLGCGLVLAGCSTTVDVEPAADANNPQCAEVMVRLPGNVDGQRRVWTDAQATAAWGSPTRIIMACGVTPPGPSTLKCIQLTGVDWLVDESDQPNYRLTTYGRSPAVQVFLDAKGTEVDPNAVLSQLGPLISAHTERTAQCTNPDTIQGREAAG